MTDAQRAALYDAENAWAVDDDFFLALGFLQLTGCCAKQKCRRGDLGCRGPRQRRPWPATVADLCGARLGSRPAQSSSTRRVAQPLENTELHECARWGGSEVMCLDEPERFVERPLTRLVVGEK